MIKSWIFVIINAHNGADNTCYSSILRNWEEKTRYEQLDELMNILCKGVDMDTAADMLQIQAETAKSLLYAALCCGMI